MMSGKGERAHRADLIQRIDESNHRTMDFISLAGAFMAVA